MPAPNFLWLIKESAYGTKKTSPAAGTDSMYIRLTESNSFGVSAKAVQTDIAYGGGLDVVAETVCDSYEVKGSLTTLLYPSQALFLLGWSLTRINAGQTAPWVTTEPVFDLASVTAYHGVRTRTGTVKRLKYTGGKVMGGEISVGRSDPKVKLKLDLVFQKEVGNTSDASSDPDATEFPEPTEALYPTGPYTFSQTSGNLSYDSAAVTQYDSVSLKWGNKLDPQWWESKWLQTCGSKGRDASLDLTALFKLSPDFRGDHITTTNKAVFLKFDNGTASAKIDFLSKTHVSDVPYDLAMGKEFYQKVTLKNKWDPTAAAGAGGDVLVTIA